MNPLQSRRFCTMLIDLIVSLVLYMTGKYAAPAMMDDVKFIILTLQPVALWLIAAYTVDDVHAARMEVQLARLNVPNVEGK